jgi:hypothetical protein
MAISPYQQGFFSLNLPFFLSFLSNLMFLVQTLNRLKLSLKVPTVWTAFFGVDVALSIPWLVKNRLTA